MLMKAIFMFFKHKFLILKVSIIQFLNQFSLGSVSKDFSKDEMKKIALNGNVYHFSIDYDFNDLKDTLNIYGLYVMKKNNIKRQF